MAAYQRNAEENAALSALARESTKAFYATEGAGQDSIEKTLSAAKALASDPLGVGLDVTMQSASQMMAIMVAAALARISGTGSIGMMVAAGGTSSALETGNRYAEKVTSGMAHEQAWTEATVEGGIVGAFDAASLGSAGRAVGTIARASLGGKLATGLKEVGKQAALGAGGEANAAWSSGNAAEPASMMAEAIGEVFGAIPGGLIAAPRAVGEAHGRVMARVAEAEQVRETAANLAELHTVAQESKTQGRDREAFQAFAAELAHNGQVSDLYIDPKDFVEYFQSRGIDPVQVAETMPSVRDQFDEAMATQAPLRIPLAEYTAHLATDAANDGLIPFMRVSESGMHAAEAEQLVAEYEQVMQQEAATALDEVQVQERNDAQVQAVRDRLAEQLTASGRVTHQVAQDSAKLAGEFYRTVGAKMGMTPEQFADVFALNVTGAQMDAAGGVRFEQGAQTNQAGEDSNYQTSINTINFNSSSVAGPVAGKAYQEVSADVQSANSGLDLAGSASASSPVVEPNAVGRAPQNDEAVSFANTERAYGGREAYDKAKADGKTKLNYNQWVQVRTPEFKAWFGDWEAASRNTDVNRQIEQWAQGDLAANVILNLGRPSSVLTEYGVPNLPITLRQAVLRKAVKDKHDVDAADLKDLARAIQSPLAVFDDAEQPNTRIVITEIRHNDGNVIAAIRMNMERDGLEINDIRSLHPKRDSSILNWVGKGLLLGLEKSKGRAWLENLAATNPQQPQVLPTLEAILYATDDISNVSKVIDPDTGEPLVVYHETSSDFSVFDLNRVGASSDDDQTPIGIFTKSKPAKIGVGDVQMPLFVNIKNPRVWKNRKSAVESLKTSVIGVGEAEFSGKTVQEVREKIRSHLEEAGYDGARLEKDGLTTDAWIAFNPTQIKSAIGNTGSFSPDNPNILMQGAEDARGFIRFDPAGITNAPSLIAMLEKADNSTFLHELGHYFFEVYNHLATLPDTPAEVKDDMAALVAFAGVDSVEAWQAMTPEARREGHEKVADAFEQYLFEGKAPSLALHGVFHMFDTRLYRPA